jgi:hypothetical protein
MAEVTSVGDKVMSTDQKLDRYLDLLTDAKAVPSSWAPFLLPQFATYIGVETFKKEVADSTGNLQPRQLESLLDGVATAAVHLAQWQARLADPELAEVVEIDRAYYREHLLGWLASKNWSIDSVALESDTEPSNG